VGGYTWVIRYNGRLGETSYVFTIPETQMEEVEEWADTLRKKGWYWEYTREGGTFEGAKQLVNNYEMHEERIRERDGI
jgi:hypothetical protein